MMSFAVASAFAGQNLSFLSCCFAFLPSSVECAAVGCMPGSEVGSKVPEIGDDLDAAFYVFPCCFVQPLLRFEATCKIVALVRGYLGSHFMEVLVRGVQCTCKLGEHLHLGADDEDVIRQNVAADPNELSHDDDPRSHDEGDVGH